jgi:GH43 family beta-xylosidase
MNKQIKYYAAILSGLLFLGQLSYSQCTFTNPLMEGADPHASFHNGKYYLLVTRADRITIKSSPKLQDIGPLTEIKVWDFKNTQVGGHIWAPELHYLDDNWYIYSCGQNTGLANNPSAVRYVQENQEMFVLKSTTGDVFGPYEFDSWLMPGTGAIDETVFTHTDGKQYITWSQFNIPGQPQTQCLYIAELLSPTSIGAKRVLISCPDQPWELNGWPVNEGAAVLEKNGKTYVVYSGSGYTTPEYALGYMVNTDGDLLNPASWTKVGPVFQQNPAGGVYSTGHNSFTTSPDGTEDWIVYHGRLSPEGNTHRYTFIQKFEWEGDVPVFGKPVPVSQEIACPSDTGWTVSARYTESTLLNIYPNPAVDILNIKLPGDMLKANYRVTNILGQVLMERELLSHEVDISRLPEGLYFLAVKSGEYLFRGSFLKQNG